MQREHARSSNLSNAVSQFNAPLHSVCVPDALFAEGMTSLWTRIAINCLARQMLARVGYALRFEKRAWPLAFSRT
jgi:hypothetical protein